MTVHRLLSEATSLELEQWRRFLKADAEEREQQRESARLEREIGA